MSSAKLRALYPLLVPLDAFGRRYEGFIQVYGDEYTLKITIPSSGKLSDAQLEGDLTLKRCITGITDVIQQRLNECANLPAFLSELQAILETQLKKRCTTSIIKPPKYFSLLMDELNDLGWHRLVTVDPLLNETEIRFLDEKQREHILKLAFPSEYPDAPPISKADLPLPFEISWTKDCRSLVEICTLFEQCLHKFQQLWDLLDEVDNQMWVLEPEHPQRGDVSRRVLLGKGSSLIFTLNPTCPSSKPTWQLLGSDKVILPLQETLNSNLQQWDELKSVVDNWRIALNIEIPTRSSSGKFEVEQSDCGICYAYRLQNEIPDIYCEDSRCKQIFHTSCLYEWLKAIPTSRQSFNVIFGECPFCSQAITCKVPGLLCDSGY